MTRTLIVNADDYGRTPGVCVGIRQAHLEGIVSTTTVMTNMLGVREEIELSRRLTPGLGMGVHLNLTSGIPCSPPGSVRSLHDADGRFHKPEALFANPEQMDAAEVELEWSAQIQVLLETGVELDHLDSHHHVAALSPDLWQLYLSFAKHHGCGVRPPYPSDPNAEALTAGYAEPMRAFASGEASRLLRDSAVPHPDALLAGFFGQGATLEHLLLIVSNLAPGVSELMTHPGQADEALISGSSYSLEREAELAALTHPTVQSALEKGGIALGTYRGALVARG